MQELDELFEIPEVRWTFWGILTIIIILIIRHQLKKQALEAQKQQMLEAIDSGAGEDGTDVEAALDNVEADTNFDASYFAGQIYDAGYSWDYFNWFLDTEAIYSALSNKTKAQIKAIEVTFQNTYNQTLDHFLREELKTSEYRKCISIIQQAK